MIAITATLAACIAILRFWPDLPLARALHGLLVLPIARRHATLTPGHWLLFGMIGAVLGTVAWLGGDLIVEARAPDGLIEAFRGIGPGFMLGVQWHPEWRVLDDPFYLGIFQAFGDACRHYAARRTH
jgi:hypothetical protein